MRRHHFWYNLALLCGWVCLHPLQEAQAKRTYYWIETTASTLQRAKLRIDKQEGPRAWTSVSALQLKQLRRQRANVLVREKAELPLPKPFLSLEEVEKAMLALANRYPKHVALINLSKRFRTPPTYEGRDLLALRFRAPSLKQQPAPTVLLDSIHHSRELITPLVLLDAAKQLAEGYGNDKAITTWLEHYEIWIVPVVNPDGYHYVFTQDPFWRKNRKANADGTFGVDLNRNYPFMWGACGRHSPNGKSEIFKGPQPGSEPEVQTLIALGQTIQPQMYLSYHSYGNEIIRPYVCATAAEEALLDRVTRQLAQAANYKFRRASSSGESFEHFYALYGSLSFLVEVGTKFHPEPSKVPALLSQAQNTWRTLLQRGMKSAVLGVIQDAQTKEPIQANLSIDEISFQAGEKRASRQDNGFYAWTLPPGKYTLRASAPGYRSQSQRIEVTSNRYLRLNLSLQKESDEPEPTDLPQDGSDSQTESVQESPLFPTPEGVLESVDRAPDTSPGTSPERDTQTPFETSPQPESLTPKGCNCQTQSEWTFGVVFLFLLLLSRKHRQRKQIEPFN